MNLTLKELQKFIGISVVFESKIEKYTLEYLIYKIFKTFNQNYPRLTFNSSKILFFSGLWKDKDHPSIWMLQEDIYTQSTEYSVNLILNFLFKIWEYAHKIIFKLFISLAAPLVFDLYQIGKPLLLES